MEWKKPSQELGKFLDTAMASFHCQKKTMFGAPVCVINGNMFAGVHGDNIFLRLSEADKAKISTEYRGATPFEPVKGRIMKEYVTIPQELYASEKLFQEWIQRSLQYAQMLKPKETKVRGKKI